MKARLAIVVLAAPILAWAADGDAKGAAAPVLPSSIGSENIKPAVIQALPRQDATHAAGWPAVQVVPARTPRAEAAAVTPARALRPDSLPKSGLQFYALIAAGIAAVGFMASRRTGS
jgi:hypothetical protein